MKRAKPWRGAVALGLVCLHGCGPIEYLTQVDRRAPAALAEAQHHGAERLAPYEYTAALEYLREAREEAARSSYQRALEYGRRAEELAARAEGIARQKNLGAHRRP